MAGSPPTAEEHPTGSIVLLAIVFEIALALVALGLGWLLDYDPLRTLRWNWRAVGWGAAATLPALALMLWCTHSSWGVCRSLSKLVDDLRVPLFAPCTTLDLAMIALSAGIGEELLFRGLIQSGLTDWLGPTAGLLGASLLFAFAHPLSRGYILFAGVFGLYLGGLWMITDNLLAPLVAHAAYDFITLKYLVSPRRPRREPASDEEQGQQEPAEQEVHE